MLGKTVKLKTCSQGHEFQKSSDCPVCPICEKNKKPDSEFPKIGAPALRALTNSKIKSLKDLSQWSEAEIMDLHGIGPSALPRLKQALKKAKLTFKK